MKKQLFLLVLNLFGFGIFAQNLVWAKGVGGTNPDEGFSIVTDASGNVYTTGHFYGTVDFDPGAGVYNLTSAGITDIFITKLDQSGNFIWARSIGSTDYDYGNAITLDGSGNVFVTGYFNFTVDFDPTGGVFNLTSAGTNDAYILKLDNNGNFIWAKRIGGTSGDEGISITTDASGNVYTSGTFYGTVDFDPGGTVFNLNSGSNSGAFISKLDNSGNFIFAKNFSGFLSEGRGITLDASGNIYTTGNYNGTVDFDPSAGVVNLTSVGSDDIFISKLNPLGNFVWAKSVGSSTWDYGYSINVDGSGNVYTSGTYGAVTDFDPGAGTVNITNAGQNDIFILKLDASGNYVWAVGFGGTGSDYGFTSKLDGFGNIYAGGSFAGTVDFDPGAGVNNLTSNGNDDAFLVKLDGSGNYVWAQGLGAATYDRYRGITVDGSNNLFTTGSYFNTVDFDPGASVVNLTSVGSSDIFISKVSCVPGLAGAISGPSAMCQGGPSANYSIPPVTGATGYSWSVPAGATITSGQNTPNINVLIGPTSGMVVVTPTNSCGSSPSVSLSVTSATSPTITSSASPAFICQAGTSTLSASGPLLLDQQSTTGVSTGFWMSLSGQQSFIAGLTGVLKKVRLHTATYASAATITVRIYSGPVGSGSLLTSVSYGKGTNTNSWDDVTLPGGGVSVSSGSPYYIEILAGSQVDWIYRNINVYANGQTWRGGTSYNYDYNFETYIDQNTYLWNPGGAPTQTFAVSPPSTTNYTVTVTNAAGCANTQMVTLNVNPNINAPTVITNVSCNGGANGAIDLIPSGGTPTYTYLWSNGATTQDITNLVPGTYNVTITDANGCTKPTSAIVTQPGLLIASSAITTSINCNGGSGVVSVSGSGGTPSYAGTGSFTVTAGTYTYNVTDANGCVKTTSITVTQPAPLTINVNAATSICSGGIANLSATGASTYTWNPGGLTGANVAVSPVSTTVYTATGTSSLGCVATNTTMVTVNPNPTVTVSSSTICIGSTATLTASGATTYSWNTGATTAVIVVSPGSTTNYVVTGTNGFGCTNTKTTTVTVNLLPTITTSASPASICVGSNSSLTAAGATTYTWNPGAIIGSTVTVSPASTTVYTVTGTNSNGCVNTQTLNLTVNSLPVVTAASSSTAICAGSTATLTGNGATSYTWNPGALTGSVTVVSPGSTTQYTVTGTNAFGCVNTQTINLTVNPLPALTLAASPPTMCIGATSTLTGTGATSYTWNPGGFLGSVIIDAPSSSTQYTVIGINGFGCVNTQTVNLTVNPLPTLTVAASPTVICVGSTATLTGTGASTYTWNPGALTGSVTTVSPGSTTIYTLTGTNSNGCVNTQTINLTVNSLPVITAAASPTAICVGATSTLTANGASTYTWNPGVLTGSATVVSPGSTTQYTVTGTNVNGCTNIQMVNLTVNPLPTLTVAASPTAICVGGTSTLTGTGATSYTWNPGALTGSITSVSPGSTTIYTLTGTNINGCVNTKTINVIVNPLPALTVVASPATICVGSTSTLTGTGANTYTWNPGALTGSVTSVSPGSTTIYTLTGTNSNGCVNTETVNITVNPLPTLTVASSPATICVGATSTLTGTGATTYTWNPGGLTGVNVSVSPASTTMYTVTGTNANGCVNTQTVNLTVNPLPTLTAAASPTAICIGSTATLTGTGALTYTWNPGVLTGSVTVVSPGTSTQYTVTGINSNGCVNTQTVNLTVNPLPTLTVASSPATICVGATSTLTANGATTFTWNPGALTGSVTVVSPGTTTQYTVTGINSNGCVNTQTVNLTVNPLPTLTVAVSPTAICIGSTATLTGTGANTYTWNPGGITGAAPIVSPGSTTQYTVTGTNGNGCVNTQTVSLTVNTLPTLTTSASPSVICVGSTATLTGTGASTYTWNPGALTGAIVSVSPASTNIYTLTGTNVNGCVNTKTLNLTVNPLPTLTLAASPATICIGGTSTLTATGAATYTWNPGALTGAATVVSPGSTTMYTVTGTNGNGCVNTETVNLTVNSSPVITAATSSAAICVGSTATLTGTGATTYTWNPGALTGSAAVVSPGSTTIYTVTGENGSGCTQTETISITVNALPVVTAVSASSAICAGETATLTAGGATTYLWDTGASTAVITVSPASLTVYTVTGTDGNNCVNSETISITVNALPLVTAVSSPTAICAGATATLTGTGAVSYTWNPGTSTGSNVLVSPASTTAYTVTGTDGNGCVNTQTVDLTVNSLPVVTAMASPTAICIGTTATLTAGGANSYLWDTGANTAVIAVSPTSSVIYTVTGTDGNGCVNTETVNLTVNALPVVTTVSSPTTICAGETATLTAGGASAYLWDTGANTSVIAVSPTSSTIYTVTGTDGNGCVNSETVSVTVNALPVITAISSPTVICAGATATITGSGATSYTWNPGGLAGSTITVNPTSSTIYTLTGTNGSGCVQTETINLTVNALPVLTANSTASAVCSGQTVTLNGSGALSYAWDNGVVDGVAFIPVASGPYAVIGTDVNGCVAGDTVFVIVNSLPVITAGSTSTAVCNGDFASLTGSGALTYTWNPGALTGATVSVNPSSNTVYTLSGTDGAGCVNTETISLTVNPLPVVTATSSSAGICAGQTSTLTAAGATSYTWNPGALTSAVIAVSPSSTTIYTVTGVDGSGCVNTGSVSLTVSMNPTVAVVSSPSVICEGQSATLTASGATTYSWNTGSSTFSTSVSPTSTSVYTVTGTNGLNCTHTETISLTVNVNPTVTIAASPSAICSGQTSTLTANGASTYLWNTSAVTSAITVSPVSTTIYTVTGTSSANCTHTETISLTVNALPAISVSPSNTTICQGQPQLLQASGAASYAWSGAGSTTNSITVTPTVATVYTVTGMDANSCVNTATAIVNTVSQPVVSINSPSTNVCMGYTMTVVASGASSYNWSNGVTTNTITVQPFSNITYSVIGSNGGACPDTAFLSLTVLPLPSVSASANNTLICAGNTVSLTAGGTAVNFLWEPGSLFGANQVVQMNAPTTFTVYGQGSNGCAFFNTTFVDVPSPSAITTAVTPTAICAGDSAILSVSGVTVSLWNSNAVPNTSVVMPFDNTTYTFSALDVNGCTSDISFTVLMKSDCDEVVVYNGFTPNGDGINDVWLIDNIEKFPNNKVVIYNRWGNTIFHTTNYNNVDNSWDGKLNGQAINAGTYFYIIVDESEKLIKKGWLEITN